MGRWHAYGLGIGLVVAAAALGPGEAVAQPADQAAADEEARVHFRLGVAYHDSGRFAEAAAEFKQAYELSKRAKLLYNLFLAYRDGGRMAEAADALERFLNEADEVPEREKLEARLEALQRIAANQPPRQAEQPDEDEASQEGEPTEEEPEEATPTAQAPEPEPEMERNPWHKITPWVAMGTGAAMIGVGAAVGTIALGDYNDCESSMTCSASELSSGTTKARLADAMIFGGAAVAGAGVLLYFLLPREREVRTTGNVACGPGSCGASVTHRF